MTARLVVDATQLEAQAVERLAGARDWINIALADGDLPSSRDVTKFAWSLHRAALMLELAADAHEATGS